MRSAGNGYSDKHYTSKPELGLAFYLAFKATRASGQNYSAQVLGSSQLERTGSELIPSRPLGTVLSRRPSSKRPCKGVQN